MSSRLGHSCDPALLKAYRILFAGRSVKPNTLSLLGAFFGALTCILVSLDHMRLGGISLLISALFDLMDGAVARNTGRVTIFGGFLDSVLDRYSDLLVMCGIGIHFARRSEIVNVVITLAALVGTALVPYARARAEAARLRCSVGILERPERTIILILGLSFCFLDYTVVTLAVLTHVTVIQRILKVRREAQYPSDQTSGDNHP